MTSSFPVQLLSSSDEVIAEIEITGTSSRHFLGRILKESLPSELKVLLDEYLDLADQQALRELDQVQTRLRGWQLRVKGIPGHEYWHVRDLQVQPSGSVAIQVEIEPST